jgi:acyl-CoA reductase-like NAD-dependent aldehyde dehydrogenase
VTRRRWPDHSWRIAQEEIFGPVLVAISWKNEDEVVALRTAHRIDSRWVQVNQGGGQVVGQSYGGMKSSGIGRELFLEGMLEGFTQIRQVNVTL